MRDRLKGYSNKKFSTRLAALFFVMALMLSNLGTLTYGKPINLEVDTPRTAKVLEVIDGEVLRVLYYYSDFKMPEIKIIKLIGVDTKGSQDAFEHTLAACLGKIIFILEDPNASTFPKLDYLDVEYGYVYNKMSRSLNEELLISGYGVLDETFKAASHYEDLKDAEALAISKELGFHEAIDSSIQPMFNINTASFTTMQTHLIDTTDEAIMAIINYRSQNIFETKTEVKFAHGSLDQTWYGKNKGLYNIVTDLNKANTYEMTSLFPYDGEPLKLAQAMSQYLVFNELEDKSELRFIDEVSGYYYDIAPFIDVKPIDVIIDPEQKVVNINTCTVLDFTEATGLSTQHGTNLIAQRVTNDYYYKNIGETLVEGAVLFSWEPYAYTDHISVFTDINKAHKFELMSLFGLFDGLNNQEKEDLAEKIIDNRPYESIDQLEPYIRTYYGTIEDYIVIDLLDLPKSINLNLADSDMLFDFVGLNANDLNLYKLYKKEFDYIKPSNIQFNLRGKGSRISLYTNINTASFYELMNLNINMTEEIADEIINFRAKEPITTLEEIRYIFSDYKRSYLYLEIEDFIVFQ